APAEGWSATAGSFVVDRFEMHFPSVELQKSSRAGLLRGSGTTADNGGDCTRHTRDRHTDDDDGDHQFHQSGAGWPADQRSSHWQLPLYTAPSELRQRVQVLVPVMVNRLFCRVAGRPKRSNVTSNGNPPATLSAAPSRGRLNT